ncbi:DUF4160 domain-containing protein [Aliamphritea hakodatensis]|uniref:DUF4160 domain-containing protein n=1 Tax=Aliamphritea hakodatensis TaxID=2895352 RepID=UPI0035E3FB50
MRISPYRFFFYSNEGSEPAHIHIQRDNKLAKFWLSPVELASATQMSNAELRKVKSLVIKYKDVFQEGWHDNCTH